MPAALLCRYAPSAHRTCCASWSQRSPGLSAVVTHSRPGLPRCGKRPSAAIGPAARPDLRPGCGLRPRPQRRGRVKVLLPIGVPIAARWPTLTRPPRRGRGLTSTTARPRAATGPTSIMESAGANWFPGTNRPSVSLTRSNGREIVRPPEKGNFFPVTTRPSEPIDKSDKEHT